MARGVFLPDAAERETMGTIRVKGLRFSAAHGVHPEEKHTSQPFEVDVEIDADLGVPATSDRLEDTIDYGRIVAVVREVMEGESCNLIERLAGKIIERVNPIARGGAVTVRVRKPGAPLAVPFDTVEVELRSDDAI
jgi:dihydroneopterin aldolase